MSALDWISDRARFGFATLVFQHGVGAGLLDRQALGLTGLVAEPHPPVQPGPATATGRAPLDHAVLAAR